MIHDTSNHTVLYDPVSGISLQLMGQLRFKPSTVYFVENTDLAIRDVAQFYKVSLSEAKDMLESSSYMNPVKTQDDVYWVE